MAEVYEIGDIVTLKKGHPCGNQIMVPRKMVEKNTKNLQKKEK